MTFYVESSRIVLPKLSTIPVDEPLRGWNLSRLLSHEGVLREAAKDGNMHTARELQNLRREIGDRFSFPLMCLAMSIVGAPIGVRAKRHGRSFTFASGVAIVAAYFILRTLLRDTYLPTLESAILVAQIPNLVLVSFGLLLIWRVDRI